MMLKRIGVDNKQANLYDMMKLQATKSELHKDTTQFIKRIKATGYFPLNVIGLLKESGDIFYSTGGGNVPKRAHNVVQGVYPKVGKLPENAWLGLIPHDEMPYMINPTRGFIVSSNNTQAEIQGSLNYSTRLSLRLTAILKHRR